MMIVMKMMGEARKRIERALTSRITLAWVPFPKMHSARDIHKNRICPTTHTHTRVLYGSSVRHILLFCGAL